MPDGLSPEREQKIRAELADYEGGPPGEVEAMEDCAALLAEIDRLRARLAAPGEAGWRELWDAAMQVAESWSADDERCDFCLYPNGQHEKDPRCAGEALHEIVCRMMLTGAFKLEPAAASPVPPDLEGVRAACAAMLEAEMVLARCASGPMAKRDDIVAAGIALEEARASLPRLPAPTTEEQ